MSNPRSPLELAAASLGLAALFGGGGVRLIRQEEQGALTLEQINDAMSDALHAPRPRMIDLYRDRRSPPLEHCSTPEPMTKRQRRRARGRG